MPEIPFAHRSESIRNWWQDDGVFNEAEFASIVTTVGQVDYWTRVIQGLGIQQVGFLDSCDLDLLNATTKK